LSTGTDRDADLAAGVDLTVPRSQLPESVTIETLQVPLNCVTEGAARTAGAADAAVRGIANKAVAKIIVRSRMAVRSSFPRLFPELQPIS
jgi:hypothetical protein